MTIADDYLARTGESIAQACERLHAAGWGIQRTAKRLGYGNASDLRRYLRKRNIECPWPKDPTYARGGAPQATITQEVIDQYLLLRTLGLSAKSAAAEVNHSVRGLQCAMHRLSINQSVAPKNISAVYKTSVQSEPSRTRCQ